MCSSFITDSRMVSTENLNEFQSAYAKARTAHHMMILPVGEVLGDFSSSKGKFVCL